MVRIRKGLGSAATAVAASAVLAFAAVTVRADNVTISVDKSQTFQTIDGNGFMHAIKPWKVREGPFLVDADITNFEDSLITVLGMSLHRYFIDGCRFSPSPGQYTIDDNMRYFYEQAQRLKAIAESNNEFYGVCPAVLSPPGYMKKNGECTSGIESTYPSNPENSLKVDQYDDLGDFSAAFISTIVDSFDMVPYAFSFQNEPYFNEPYSSCSYSGGRHYAAMLKEAGPKVRALGYPIAIYGVEHMAHTYPSWERAIYGDAESAPYLDRDAVHGYSDGNLVDTNTFARLNPKNGKPLWMSETSFGAELKADHDGAMDLANMFIGAYRYSSISAWIHVSCMTWNSGGGGFVDNETGVPTPAYWVIAQFWRFMRPGMQRISVTSSNDSVKVVAFKDDRVSSMSVILVNASHSDHTAQLAISGGDAPPQFDIKRTTDTEKFVLVGTAAPTEAVELPAQSVVSLGYNYIGTGVPPGLETGVVRPKSRPANVGNAARSVRVYDLRGRLISRYGTARVTSGNVSAAAYCVDNGVRHSLTVVR
jgi:O-glycosyl hydrolase